MVIWDLFSLYIYKTSCWSITRAKQCVEVRKKRKSQPSGPFSFENVTLNTFFVFSFSGICQEDAKVNINLRMKLHFAMNSPIYISFSSWKLLRIKVTQHLHLTYSKNGSVLKMLSIACISILLTKHAKYTYLYLLKFVLYSIVAFKAN